MEVEMQRTQIDRFCGQWRPKYLEGLLIPAAFAACVSTRPSAPCLVAEDGSTMSFYEVNAAASKLARRLVARGVGKDKAVAILFDRQPAVVISMIAVHKAGGCYVPLDPNFPADRLSIYVEDSDSLAIITEPSQAGLAMSLAAGLPLCPEILLFNDPADPAACDNSIVLPDVNTVVEDDLAYIMFTSGSTGRPKGVMVPHRGVRDLVEFNVERFGLSEKDVFCLNSTVCFDSYVTYVFASLSLGGKLVVPGPTAHLDPYGMASLIAEHGITMMEVVPALAAEYMGAFKEAGDSIKCLTHMLTGGEALTPNLAEAICTTVPGLAKGGLFNSYGPTEVTVTTITGHIKAPFDRIPLGRPDYNVHTYVVLPVKAAAAEGEIAPAGEEDKPVGWRLAEVGEPGELWLSGPRLARGYHRRADLTAAAFVPNPWFEAATAALGKDKASLALKEHYKIAYRTNDLVVMGADGQLEYLGRADRQIKIDGVRMEISEVEAVLAGAQGVTHAAVKPWKDANGTYRLCGYVAPDTIDLAEAEAHCRGKLLPAMVPSKIVKLTVMPKLPNGKIDVKSLEEPDWGARPGGGSSSNNDGPAKAPSTDMEQLLADIWTNELKVDKTSFSVKSDFFGLGGNSLRAGLVNSKIRRATGADISGLLIYQHSSVTAMAAAIESQYGKFAKDADSQTGSFIAAGSSYQSSSSLFSSNGRSSSQSSSSGDDKHHWGTTIAEEKEFITNGSQIRNFGSKPLPVWLATLGQIGGTYLLGLIAYVAACGFMEAIYRFALLRPAIYLVPVFVLGLFFGTMVFGLLYTIALKWALLGKQKPGVHAIWSWYYVRWWIVGSAVKGVLAGIFPVVRRTPIFVWYLRALGCKIGKNVSIDTANIGDWDMVTIGDDTVLENDSFIDGSGFYAAKKPGDRGIMVVDYTTVGKNCTLLPTSITSSGTTVPDNYLLTPGTTSQRLPSGPADAQAHKNVRTEHKMLPLWLCLLTVFILIGASSLMVFVIIPSIYLWLAFIDRLTHLHLNSWDELIVASRSCWIGGVVSESQWGTGHVYHTCHSLWYTLTFSLLIAPGMAFVWATAYMWFMVPVKWLIVGKMTQEKMDKGGLWLAWRRHLFKCLLSGPWQSIVWQFTSTEVYNLWLRLLGAKIGRQCWLSEQFKCTEFELFECKDTASMCSMVTLNPCTSGRTERVVFGEACDVTNDCTIMAGAHVGTNAVLGLFTYAPPGKSYADYSITLGDFTLRPGVSNPKDVEAGLASAKFESSASRLLPTWMYTLYNVLYVIGSNIIFVTTGAMMSLPAGILGMWVLYHMGYFIGLAFTPVYLVLAFVAFIGYLALLRLLIAPREGGQHPIFRSFKCACWQLLCINCHIYGEFTPLKGSILYNWYVQAMGTKVGKEVLCLGGVVAEYEHVSIGDGCVIGDGAFLLTHTVENRHVKIRPISLGQQCTVGALSAVLPDANMEDFATLAEMSLVMKGETIPAHATWAGIPASPMMAGKHIP